MSEGQTSGEAEPSRAGMKWALWGVAGLGVAAVVYIIAQASINPSRDGDLKALAKGAMSKLELPAGAGPPPATGFQDAAGRTTRIADFRGKVTVVNVWATWCGPCVIEMPTLAALAKSYECKDVVIVPVSIDSDDKADQAKAFIAGHPPLAFYRDPKRALPFEFTPVAVGMPTTVIYGRDGVERARLAGDANWSSDEAKAVIDRLLAET